MPDLIAQGDDRWRRGLPEIAAGREVLLGRQPQSSPPPPRTGKMPLHGENENQQGDNQPASDAIRSDYADARVSSAAAVDQPQRRHVAAIPWAVPWDYTISRHHAILRIISGDRLQVTRDPRARNPIFYRGKPREQFVVVPGEHFVIGQTTFTLVRRPGFTGQPESAAGVSKNADTSPRRGTPLDSQPATLPADAASQTPDYMVSSPVGEVTEMAFVESALRQRSFHDTQARIELLARLPDLVAGSVSDEELFARVTDVLMRATPSASAVAIVRATINDSPGGRVAASADGELTSPTYTMQILHYDVRNHESNSHDVSTKLVTATLRRRESVLHLWDNPFQRDPAAAATRSEATPPASQDYTATENIDWAFCVPLRSDACRGWVLYVTGSRGSMVGLDGRAGDSQTLVDRLSDDVKFAEVVGSLVSGIRQANQFQQRHAAMRRFFAPVVLDAIAGTDSESWLQPRECDLSVMFCDLRGFSRSSEVHSGQLLVLLEQVSAALGVMTKHILETEGVIGDFHGDAAMGFWGWPLPLPHGTDPVVAASTAAAQAAADIRRDYARGQSNFRCGIGIASGKAVAGRIGTVDQVKVTAFGPVVNLASRLEGLTKIFGVEILVDQITAKNLCDPANGSIDGVTAGGWRLRTLGRVRAAGTQTPVEIFQLIVPVEHGPQLTDAQLELSRDAFAAFGQGRWDDAYQQLHELPAWDRPKDVLLQRILQHHRVAPPDWNGALEFSK